MHYEVVPVQVPGSKEMGSLTLYLWDHDHKDEADVRRPVVLICPGGGYEYTSPREGEPLAMKFLGAGYHAAVLRYSCAPARYPEALLQLAWSVHYLRSHAMGFHIGPNRVIVLGCSAGGHLAASLGVFWNKKPFLSGRLGARPEDIRPDGLLLCYPVINSGDFAHKGSFEALLGDRYPDLVEEMSLEGQVDEETPRTFLWHTMSDESVPVENSILFFSALRWFHVPCEMHIYPVGVHGLSLASEETQHEGGRCRQKECESWLGLALDWLGTF